MFLVRRCHIILVLIVFGTTTILYPKGEGPALNSKGPVLEYGFDDQHQDDTLMAKPCQIRAFNFQFTRITFYFINGKVSKNSSYGHK